MLGNHQAVIKPDIDGEPRDVEIEAVLELDLKAYREFKMPLLKDMYANDRKLKLKTSPITFENLIFQNNAKTKVSQRVEAAGEIHKLLQVLNVEGNVESKTFSLLNRASQRGTHFLQSSLYSRRCYRDSVQRNRYSI